MLAVCGLQPEMNSARNQTRERYSFLLSLPYWIQLVLDRLYGSSIKMQSGHVPYFRSDIPSFEGLLENSPAFEGDFEGDLKITNYKQVDQR